MDESVLLSIIVAVYNIEEYIDRCLQSLACCTEKQVEIIIIDDGSTDNSSDICKEYAKNDGRFFLIRQNNGGLSSARNKGISKANGEYIVFIDGDDYILPEMLDSFIQWLNTHRDAELICNDYFRCDSNGCKEISQVKKMSDKSFENALLFGKGFWNVWRYCYKRKAFFQEGLLFKEGYLCEDVDFTTKAWISATKATFISIPFYCYQVGRAGSIMYSPNPKRTQDLVFIIGELLSMLEKLPEQEKAQGMQTRLFREYVLALPQMVDNGGKKTPVGKKMQMLLDKFCTCPPVQTKARVIRFVGLGFCARILYTARAVKNM